MQVYAALYSTINAKPYVLVAKKRELNSWWKGKNEACPTYVNGAGQWVFPGGKVEEGYSVRENAEKEFKEETGLAFPDYEKSEEKIFANGKYTLCTFKIIKNLKDIAQEINDNIKEVPGFRQPSSDKVSDWELALVNLVEPKDLDKFLGVNQINFLREETQQYVLGLPDNDYSQSIDWYKNMAGYLKGKLG
ncbi:NUDIX domain-containing protein [Rhodovastum atsumiense]|uniref:NUDIX domain-containing protein n=2 Tax=Rhodovastum atsumiense TaxID=504468 RepID=A0A5M6IXU4_9PROT|nr:NUDIX domain-containing protein [Rhodovastum atsumiense]CAH2601266.1 NUDIX domain-containing protein [Rhodovastum atsumiense]